jgi:CRP-like cAMP-binding protein
VAGEPRPPLVAGDHFGEIALMTGSDRTATVTARSDLRCHALTPWDFRTLIEANPSIAWQVMQSMAERLA